MKTSLLDKLERRLGRYALPNLTVYLLMGQVFVYVLFILRGQIPSEIPLVPALVLEGEVWRIFAFAFVPPTFDPFWLIIEWYLFFLMGTALEHYWGTFRYNVYLLVGYVLTVLVSFITPEAAATNVFLGASVFLAFAYLYPEFVLYVFLVLPVRVKWLAGIMWVIYAVNLVTGDVQTKWLILASVANFAMFFGGRIIWRLKMAHRRATAEVEQETKEAEPLHTCATCGATDISNAQMDFRYCTKCDPVQCYCEEHIGDHEHVSGGPEDAE